MMQILLEQKLRSASQEPEEIVQRDFVELAFIDFDRMEAKIDRHEIKT